MINRKQYDKKYKQSEKGKETQKKWVIWEVTKKYYKEDFCELCNQYKKIISKGRCDSCRKKK